MLCLSWNDSKRSSHAERPYTRPAPHLHKGLQQLAPTCLEVPGLRSLAELAELGLMAHFLPTDVAMHAMTHVRCSVSTIGKSSGL